MKVFLRFAFFVQTDEQQKRLSIAFCYSLMTTFTERWVIVNQCVKAIIKYWNNTLCSRINCPYLLSCICLDVPVRRPRHTKALKTKKSRLSLQKNDFMPRTLTSVDSMNSVDFFDRSLTKDVISLNLS